MKYEAEEVSAPPKEDREVGLEVTLAESKGRDRTVMGPLFIQRRRTRTQRAPLARRQVSVSLWSFLVVGIQVVRYQTGSNLEGVYQLDLCFMSLWEHKFKIPELVQICEATTLWASRYLWFSTV